MHFMKSKKSKVLTSLMVGALVTTAFTAADARPRYAKVRQQAAAFTGDTATIDDRYAHVQSGVTQRGLTQGAFAPQQRMTRQSVRQMRQAVRQNAAANPAMGAMALGGGSGLVSQARAYLGSNPTGKASLWCARFLNMVLERNGRRGTGSDMASSFASYGTRVSGPQVGAIAVMSRGKRGGHVGIVSGIDEAGNPIIISGNHGGRVGESAYPRGRIYSYVMP
jgi:uncharacterized protein (TIGR02594 family)